MKNLLEQAVLSLEQQKVKEIFVEDEEFYVETCDCQDLDEMIKGILIDMGDLEIEEIDVFDYINENEDISEFVEDLLTSLGIEEDEIENYLCETTIENSFLDIEPVDGFFLVTPNFKEVMAFYTTYLEV